MVYEVSFQSCFLLYDFVAMVCRLFGVEHLFAVVGTVVGNAKADTVRASEPRRVSAGGCVGHPLTSLC